MDFFVHVEDAYPHFWPIFDWRFESPVSYWDAAYFGNWVAAGDALLVFVLLYLLYRVTDRRWTRWGAFALALFYVAASTTPLFRVIFSL